METTRHFPFSVIDGGVVDAIIRGQLNQCMGIIEQAYREHGAGRTVNPSSAFLRFPDKPNARIIALPAHLSGADGVSGLKWIASYPDNIARGMARASAVLILNDVSNGYPFACIESSVISASRTAASAVLAAKLARSGNIRVDCLGIVGCGYIARCVYDFLIGTGWEISRVRLHDHREHASRRLGEILGQGPHNEICVSSLEETVAGSDLVVFATTALVPYVSNGELFAHRPVVLHLSLRDVAPQIVLECDNLTDDVSHAVTAGTSLQLAEQLVGNRSFVTGTIPELIAGHCRIQGERPVLIAPFGLGILDVALGKWVYDIARKTDRAMNVPNFFPMSAAQ